MEAIVKAAPSAALVSVCREDPPATPAPPARLTFAGIYVIACKALRPQGRRLEGGAWGVEDIIHDTAIVAHREIHRYVPPPDCTEPERALGAWLRGIARKLSSRYRKRWERPPMEEENARGPGPEALVRDAERRHILAGVLREIRPERAEVLIAHLPGGLSVPEIARQLGVNENTVKSRIHRGLDDARGAMRRRKLSATQLLPEG